MPSNTVLRFLIHRGWAKDVTRFSLSLCPIVVSCLQLCEAFDLLGAQSDLMLELDGFTVISNSPLSLFRDGDTVTIRSKGQGQKATVPITNGIQAEGGKRKRSEVALALTAAGNYGSTSD